MPKIAVIERVPHSVALSRSVGVRTRQNQSMPKPAAAAVTLNWANAVALTLCSATFPATIFAAQQMLVISINTRASAWLRPCCSACFSSARPTTGLFTNSTTFPIKGVLAHRRLLDAVEISSKAEPRCFRHADRAVAVDGDFRIDNVFRPIPPAGGNVTRQAKAR